eukprot:scaffold13354_cov181-Alexandrium_tamarense.AAC.16
MTNLIGTPYRVGKWQTNTTSSSMFLLSRARVSSISTKQRSLLLLPLSTFQRQHHGTTKKIETAIYEIGAMFNKAARSSSNSPLRRSATPRKRKNLDSQANSSNKVTTRSRRGKIVAPFKTVNDESSNNQQGLTLEVPTTMRLLFLNPSLQNQRRSNEELRFRRREQFNTSDNSSHQYLRR